MDQLIHVFYALLGFYFFTMLWDLRAISLLVQCELCNIYQDYSLFYLTGRLLKSVEVDVSWASLSNWMVRQGGTC